MFTRIREKFFSNDITYTVSFNWITVITFCFFWSYGVFGFFTIPRFGIGINIFVSILFAACFLYLLQYRKRASIYDDSFAFSQRNISIFILYVVVMGVLSSGELLMPLSGDNFYHAQQSVSYAVHFILIISKYTHLLDQFSFSFLIWCFNVLTLFVVLALYMLLKRKSFLISSFFLSSLFIVLRAVIYFSGGNTSPFPTLRLFPHWVTSTLFGLSDFSLRLASFIPLTVLMFFIYKVSYKKLGSINAFLFGLVSGTIPVLWHVGLLVEFSVWTGILFTYLLFFFSENRQSTESYVRPFSLIGISTLLRISGFIALIPLCIHYLLSHKRTVTDFVQYCKYSVPTIILIGPVVIGNMITGTSATYRGDAYDLLIGIPAHSSLLHRLYVAVHDGYLFTSLYNSFHIPLLLLLCFLPFYFRKKIYTFLPTLAFTSICFVLFFSIRPVLWGNGRYQAEYIAPLIIAAILSLLIFLRKTAVTTCVLITIFAYNIFEFKHIPNYNQVSFGRLDYFESAKHQGDYFILSEFPFDYLKALKEAKNEGFATSTYYFPGNGYSYFAKILSGYTVSEMAYESRYRNSIGFDFSTIDKESIKKIINNKEINIILLNRAEKDNSYYIEKINNVLKDSSYKEWKSFIQPAYGNVITGYIRK